MSCAAPGGRPQRLDQRDAELRVAGADLDDVARRRAREGRLAFDANAVEAVVERAGAEGSSDAEGSKSSSPLEI